MQSFEELETLLWCGDELYCVDAGPRGLTTVPRFSWAKGGRTLPLEGRRPPFFKLQVTTYNLLSIHSLPHFMNMFYIFNLGNRSYKRDGPRGGETSEHSKCATAPQDLFPPAFL